jgi:uncharacterized protein (TIGR00369 family)
MPEKTPKPVSASEVTLTQLMLPSHANAFGNVHGGVIMKVVDETAAISAMRHAQRPCVTIAIDSMTFREPVHVGQLLSCSARVQYVGRTSIEVGVHVVAENPITAETTHTNSAFAVYVALDDSGRPCEVPPLALSTDDERRRHAEGERRQRRRLEHRRDSAGSEPAPIP